MIRFRSATAADMMARAREAPAGRERVDRCFRAVVLADRAGDLDAAFDARNELIEAAYYADAKLEQLAAFAWCLNAADRHPGRFAWDSLLWTYKWVADSLTSMTEVPLALVDQVIDDLEQRYARAGLGSAAADQLRMMLAIDAGRREQLPALYQAWDENRDLAGSDCTACRQSQRVGYHLAMGDDAGALEAAAPLLAGRMRCGEVPHSTYGEVLLPLVRLGRLEEAAAALVRGSALIREREGFVETFGRFLAFLAIAGHVDHGWPLLQRRLKAALQTRLDLAALAFHRGAQALCRRALLAGETITSLSLSPRFELFEPDGVYDVSVLERYFGERVTTLTGRFDRRNGNTVQADLNAEVAALVERQLKIPLKTPRRKDRD